MATDALDDATNLVVDSDLALTRIGLNLEQRELLTQINEAAKALVTSLGGDNASA